MIYYLGETFSETCIDYALEPISSRRDDWWVVRQ
jgi:hypothetical protein